MNKLMNYQSLYWYLCNNLDVYTSSYFMQIGKASAGIVYTVLHVALQERSAFIVKNIRQQQI